VRAVVASAMVELPVDRDQLRRPRGSPAGDTTTWSSPRHRRVPR
jgi:hypothetical protein